MPYAIPSAQVERFHHGVECFNAGRWFEAHEVWEDLWRNADGELKLAYQALVLTAVSLEHARRGNPRGSLITLDRAASALRRSRTTSLSGYAVSRLIDELAAFLEPLRALGARAWPPRRRLAAIPLNLSAAPQLHCGADSAG